MLLACARSSCTVPIMQFLHLRLCSYVVSRPRDVLRQTATSQTYSHNRCSLRASLRKRTMRYFSVIQTHHTRVTELVLVLWLRTGLWHVRAC